MDLRKIAGTLAMSFDLAMYAWPITAVVLIAAVWGIFSLGKLHKLGAWQTLVVLGSSVFPALIAPAYAVRFWASPGIQTPETQEGPLNALVAGWAVFAVVLVVAISLARGFRLALGGAASLVVWFGAGVYMISIMAVSGVWL